MKIQNKTLNENDIIHKYLKKLNFKKKESFFFNNDGAFLKNKKNYQIIVTNDTIIENVDFFKTDDPSSIAQKIITYNLSDLSAMGALPETYTLSLSLPKGVNIFWLKKFIKKLYYLQNKYKFFLIGGDIGKSKQLVISANFFGYSKKKFIIKRKSNKIGNTIWVTGNIGDSFIGLLLKKKKIRVINSFKKYFFKKYLYPEPCMFGSDVSKIVTSGIDISDGFIGDLSKLINDKFGAELKLSNIPFSKYTQKLINLKKIKYSDLLSGGDDYQLILTIDDKNEHKLKKLANKSKIKLTKVGKIIKNKGIFLDGKKLNNTNNSFEYFF